MIQQDYIMLIINCKRYVKKAKFQKMTWLPRIPEYLQYYHVIGEPELATDYEFDDINRILRVKTADDYVSLPKKVIAAYKAVYETFSFKYIFKTDDDQILVNDKLFGILKGLTSNSSNVIHYGGYIVKIENHLSQYHKIHPELPPYLPMFKTRYCTGRFYFLSSQAIISLLAKRKQIEKEYFEDYAIGYHLDPHYKLNMLNFQTNQYFTDIELSDYPELLKSGRI